jgi:putative alpha-1,2-mannosidase
LTFGKSWKNILSLTRREFIGAGSGAVAATVLLKKGMFAQTHSVRQPVDVVDPFIGTTSPGLRWMMFPGVSLPFGMVKLSPDNKAWSGRAGSGRAGYDYTIPTSLDLATFTLGRWAASL